MDKPVRIGIAGVDDRRLPAELHALPLRPEVHVFPSLYEGTGPLVALQPDVLFIGIDEDHAAAADLVGALRLLRALLPSLSVVAVAPAAREVPLRDLCARTGALLLVTPFQPRDLASTLDHALAAADRPRDEVFLDLARGFADEINNPLLFLMGHLQLLQLQADPEGQKDQLDQLASALAGASRIQATVDRIRLLAQAASGPRQHERIDLFAEVSAAIARHVTLLPLPAIVREPDDARFEVDGDGELLRPALDLLVRVAAEMHALGCGIHFVLTRLEAGLRLRLSLLGPGLEDWRLPRTFEPYYLNRLLRGSSQGLSLFLVQTAVHSHRGLATARRLPDGSLAIDLVLRPA